MTPGIQSPFFLLLLLTVLTATTAPKPATVVTGSGHASSAPGGEKETSATQRSSVPSSTEKNASGAGVPGWGIALLVLVCVLVALAIVYLIALAVCQCRRKNYGQLDIFPARDTYHPMSEYPTYHTHGRYVPPSSTDRSPYEKVSAGNGGSSLSYTNPAVAATSANL
ncbi:MUC1 isoform 22 [Pan troglodytes]|uniref:MUC1 isoform 22 n=1 Tax=Pan troglodytes TaxID=9598 RepID=A0A2J8Q2X4_PANTR|nr:MUC1 isoform 22 [Pan troglodytes]